jgi:eukaryotic-like serine/threonine-protein kinase
VSDGQHFMAMEYLEGASLNAVATHVKPSFALRAKVLLEVLEGLEYAHDLRDYDGTPLHIVHRDISPHNVFVTYTGQVKVLDFGIAKAVTSSHETQAGVLKGKVAYMSPEQVLNGDVDRRVDVFAAGVMIWLAVTGRLPWDGESDVKKLLLVCSGQVPSPRTVRPNVDPELERICNKALAFELDERYATAEELGVDLEKFIEANGRVTSNEVAKLMTELFEAERSAVRHAVDQHLTKLKAEPQKEHTAIMLSVPPPDASGTPFGVAMGQETTGARAAPPRSRGRTVGYAAAALALVSCTAVGVTRWQSRHLLAAAPPPPQTVTNAPAPESPTPAMIQVSVQVSPPSARAYLDDAPLDHVQFVGRFPSDGTSHRMRFEADGFEPASRLVSFDHDVALDIDLLRAAPSGKVKARGGGGTPVRPPPASAPSTTTLPPATLVPPSPQAPPTAKPRPSLDKVDL